MHCEFCNGRHHLASCNVYKTAAERAGRLRHLEQCLRCINKFVPCECRTKRTCRYCEERHHFALCPRKFGGIEEGEIVDISGTPSPKASGRKREYASPSEVPNASGRSQVRARSGSRHPGTTTAVDDKDKKRERDAKHKPASCDVCKGPHRAEKCDVYDTALKRLEQVRIQGKCRRCLQSGHFAANCTRTTLCTYCKQRHHVSLCFQKFSNRRTSRSPSRSTSQAHPKQRKSSLSPTTVKRPRYSEKLQKSEKHMDEERPRNPETSKTPSSRSSNGHQQNEDSELLDKLRKQLAEERKMREDLRKAFKTNLDNLAKQKHEELQMAKRELETMREVVDRYKKREKDMDDDKRLFDTERATLDEQKKQLERDRQAFESDRTKGTAQPERRTADTSTEPDYEDDDKNLAVRETDFNKIKSLEEELQNTRRYLQAAERLCEEAHRRIEEQFSKRRLLRDRYFEIMDERAMLQAENRSLQLTIKFREQSSKRRVGRELQNLPLNATAALSSSALAENIGATRPLAESARKANAVAGLQEHMATHQNEFSQEHIRLYSSFIGLNLNISDGLKEIVAFLTTHVPESALLAQNIVSFSQDPSSAI